MDLGGCAEAKSCLDIVFEFVQLSLVDIEDVLNLCLQVASTIMTFANSLDLDQAQQNFGLILIQTV